MFSPRCPHLGWGAQPCPAVGGWSCWNRLCLAQGTPASPQTPLQPRCPGTHPCNSESLGNLLLCSHRAALWFYDLWNKARTQLQMPARTSCSLPQTTVKLSPIWLRHDLLHKIIPWKHSVITSLMGRKEFIPKTKSFHKSRGGDRLMLHQIQGLISSASYLPQKSLFSAST